MKNEQLTQEIFIALQQAEQKKCIKIISLHEDRKRKPTIDSLDTTKKNRLFLKPSFKPSLYAVNTSL